MNMKYVILILFLSIFLIQESRAGICAVTSCSFYTELEGDGPYNPYYEGGNIPYSTASVVSTCGATLRYFYWELGDSNMANFDTISATSNISTAASMPRTRTGDGSVTLSIGNRLRMYNASIAQNYNYTMRVKCNAVGGSGAVYSNVQSIIMYPFNYTLGSPSNITYFFNANENLNVTINTTMNGTATTKFYSLDGGAYVSYGAEPYYLNVTEGFHMLNIKKVNAYGKIVIVGVNFTVSRPFNVSVFQIANTTYGNETYNLPLILNGTGLISNVTYSLNGEANVTVANGSILNITNTIPYQNITVFATDIFGNVSNSTTTYFSLYASPDAAACGNITSAGYSMTSDLTYYGGSACFVFNQSGGTLNCNGKKIIMAIGYNPTVAIQAVGVNNIKIVNCTVVNSTKSIYIYNSNNSVLDNVTVLGRSETALSVAYQNLYYFGIASIYTRNMTMKNVTIDGANQVGLYLGGVQATDSNQRNNITITDSSFLNTSRHGNFQNFLGDFHIAAGDVFLNNVSVSYNTESPSFSVTSIIDAKNVYWFGGRINTRGFSFPNTIRFYSGANNVTFRNLNAVLADFDFWGGPSGCVYFMNTTPRLPSVSLAPSGCAYAGYYQDIRVLNGTTQNPIYNASVLSSPVSGLLYQNYTDASGHAIVEIYNYSYGPPVGVTNTTSLATAIYNDQYNWTWYEPSNVTTFTILITNSTCGNKHGNVILDSDVNATNDMIHNGVSDYSCVVPMSDNIVVDCNGHSIYNQNQSVKTIFVNAQNKSNVTVKNCVINNFWMGVYLYNSNYSSVLNNTIFNSSEEYLGFGSGSGPNYDYLKSQISLVHSNDVLIKDNILDRPNLRGLSIEGLSRNVSVFNNRIYNMTRLNQYYLVQPGLIFIGNNQFCPTPSNITIDGNYLDFGSSLDFTDNTQYADFCQPDSNSGYRTGFIDLMSAVCYGGSSTFHPNQIYIRNNTFVGGRFSNSLAAGQCGILDSNATNVIFENNNQTGYTGGYYFSYQVNTSFLNESGLNKSDMYHTFNQYWQSFLLPVPQVKVGYYIKALVKDNFGNPVNGATIQVRNSTSNEAMQSSITDSNGLTSDMVLWEFGFNNTYSYVDGCVGSTGNITCYTPHNFTASKSGYAGNTSVYTINYSFVPLLILVQNENPPVRCKGKGCLVSVVSTSPFSDIFYNGLIPLNRGLLLRVSG